MERIELGNIQETMLIPLVIKASESLRETARIHDEKAVEIVKALDIPVDKFDKFMSHEGVVARTIMFDRAVEQCLNKYPDAVCINIGCGLDNRFSRVDNGRLSWYDVDLPDAIGLRSKFFTDTERLHMIEGSVLDASWAGQIPENRPVLIIAEGLFMYFTRDEITKILTELGGAFPRYILVAELMSAFTSGKSKYHDTVKNTKAEFKWGTKSGRELEELCAGLTLVRENSLNDEMKKYTLRGKVFATIPKIKDCNNRLAVFKYEKP